MPCIIDNTIRQNTNNKAVAVSRSVALTNDNCCTVSVPKQRIVVVFRQPNFATRTALNFDGTQISYK